MQEIANWQKNKQNKKVREIQITIQIISYIFCALVFRLNEISKENDENSVFFRVNEPPDMA